MAALRRSLSSSSSAPLAGKPTVLRQRHVQARGQLVDFAGYQLPVLFEGQGVLKEHLHTREAASVFDVSHMGQIKVRGARRVEVMERLVVADVRGLLPGRSTLSVLTNERGGIIDDAIVSNADSHLHVVVNGACKDKDLAHMRAHAAGTDVTFELLPSSETMLVALQGPRAASALQTLLPKSGAPDLSKLGFMAFLDDVPVAGVRCRVSRCGYTGEDGFEISASRDAVKVYDALVGAPSVAPAGLGARDSLRLEAGLCLYGHDLNEDVLPAEAGLAWLVHKRRRTPDHRTFLGAEHVLRQIEDPGTVRRRRVGFQVPLGAPAREGAIVLSRDNDGSDDPKRIGTVTSGTFSPILKRPLGMAYVDADHAKVGTKIFVVVRDKKVPAEVSKMPFVETRYFKGN